MELKITDHEYKQDFIEHMMERSKCSYDDANAEYEGCIEALGEEHVGEPVDDAEECMSYWYE